MIRLIGSYIQDIKAYFRGEIRIAPRNATRGRIYEKKNSDTEPSNDAFSVKKTPTAILTIKVTRTDGTVETRAFPATAVRIN